MVCSLPKGKEKMEINQKQKKALLYAQQGELDAVLMYRSLAKVAKKQQDREAFLRLASEEGRHAAVFYGLTGETLKPKSAQAKALVILYKLLGRKRLYPHIAKGEYAAVKKYEALISAFPEVKSVQADEKRHGDEVRALLD